tara:strand:+ start:790 stop:1119 length:330 start_codon:yes stop_codon:yes gene_type:complete
MKRTEKAYIQLDLESAIWNVDIENNAMEDILDTGIDCYPEDVYKIIYEGYNCDEDKLKMLLDEPDNSKNMWYPLDCLRDLSYDDWIEYKQEREEDERRRDALRYNNATN